MWSVLSNPSLRFLYFRNPCCGKETKKLTQFFQVPYLCQQNSKNSTSSSKGEAKEKAEGWIRLLGWNTSERQSPCTFIPCLKMWIVSGVCARWWVISARLRQEKEIAAALWHTKSVNAVNIIAKKFFFRTPTPVCRHQVWSDHLIETPASFWGWKLYLRDTRTS